MSFPTLPSQREVYEALISGKHLCAEDGDVYAALRDNEDDFKAMFRGFGMTLIADPRGFYYMEGTRVPANMKDILFFMAIFFEHLDEEGQALDEIVHGGLFYIKDLPHLNHQRYAETMERCAGIKTEEQLRQILAAMARYRFLVMDGGDAFRFRVSAFRLFDLMGDAKNAMGRTEAENVDAAASEKGD